jgi:hypothetical protein
MSSWAELRTVAATRICSASKGSMVWLAQSRCLVAMGGGFSGRLYLLSSLTGLKSYYVWLVFEVREVQSAAAILRSVHCHDAVALDDHNRLVDVLRQNADREIFNCVECSVQRHGHVAPQAFPCSTVLTLHDRIRLTHCFKILWTVLYRPMLWFTRRIPRRQRDARGAWWHTGHTYDSPSFLGGGRSSSACALTGGNFNSQV